MPTGYSSKVSLNTNLGRINSLKRFQKNKLNAGSTDHLLANPNYLSISNLKENPKGSNHHQHKFKKKKLGQRDLLHSRSKEDLEFYSNVISPIAGVKIQENANLYDNDKRGFMTHRGENLNKHQKSASLVESNLHNLYSLSKKSSSKNNNLFN